MQHPSKLTLLSALLLVVSADRAAAAPPDPTEPPGTPRLDLQGDPLPPGALFRLGTFSPDGKVVAALGGDGLRLWDAATRKEVHRIESLQDKDPCLTFLDGLLASGDSKGDILFWDVKTGKQFRQFTRTGRGVLYLCASPDGKLLASSHDKDTAAVRLWDVSTGKELFSLYGTRNNSRGCLEHLG